MTQEDCASGVEPSGPVVGDPYTAGMPSVPVKSAEYQSLEFFKLGSERAWDDDTATAAGKATELFADG